MCWYSSIVHKFVLMFLTSSTFSLDYGKLSLDAITGNLVKPQGWSMMEFHLVKELRIKVISYSDINISFLCSQISSICFLFDPPQLHLFRFRSVFIIIQELLRYKYQDIQVDPRLFPEDHSLDTSRNKTRRKRSVVDRTRITEDETAVVLQVGLYREVNFSLF